MFLDAIISNSGIGIISLEPGHSFDQTNLLHFPTFFYVILESCVRGEEIERVNIVQSRKLFNNEGFPNRGEG